MNRTYTQPSHRYHGESDRDHDRSHDHDRDPADTYGRFRQAPFRGSQDHGSRFEGDSGHGYYGDRQMGEYDRLPEGRFGEGEQRSTGSMPRYPGRYGRESSPGYGLGFGEAGRPSQEGRGERDAPDYYRSRSPGPANEPAWNDAPSPWRGEGYYSDFATPDFASYGINDRYARRREWDHRGRAPESGRAQRSGPKGYIRSDERIKDDVCEHLYHSRHVDVSEVSVDVQGGKVTLEGTVPERGMKHRIEDIVEPCIGVHDIDNRIRVRQSGGGSWGSERIGASTPPGSSGAESNGSKAGSRGSARNGPSITRT